MESAEQLGQLIDWDTGEAELEFADVPTDVPTGGISAQHRRIETRADLDQALALLVAWVDPGIFDRTTPPSFGVVMDETVLYRCIGSPEVMHDQLLRLVELSERPRITIQILPANVGANVGLLGAFAIAGFAGDTPGMVYFETPDEGEVARHPDRVARMMVTYDALRDEALGARASRDLMRKVAEETWTA